MKQGTAVTRVVIILLLAAVLTYLGVALWQGLSDPYQLVVTYAYEMDDAAQLSGAVIRAEETIPGQGALAQVLPQEGERVSAGSEVALIYQDREALASRQEARELELELEQLSYSLRRGDTVGDAKELDAQLIRTLAQMKSEVSSGQLDALEERGLNIRTVVIRRTGSASTSAQSQAQLQATMAQLESRLAELDVSSSRSTRRVTVDRGGLFSGLADGFESILTPQTLDELTLARLDQLRDQDIAAPEDSLGKLITGSTWYYAAGIDSADARRLTQGDRYTLTFSGDFNQEVPMTLERLGEEEGGQVLAVFSADRSLNQVTLARFVNARLVFERYTGVRIPDKSLRVRDNGDGTTTPGVYALVGRQVEFKAVEVIREGEGFYLVRGTDANRKVLRPGDTLVLSGQKLYDGKVVA